MPDGSDPTLLPFIGKFLDWPFLLFVLALILMFRSGSAVLDLIKGRKLQVEVGGNKLSIGEAVQALDEQSAKDLKKVQEEIGTFKLRLAALESALTKPGRAGNSILNFDDLSSQIQKLGTTSVLGSGIKLDATLESLGALAESPKDQREAVFRRMLRSLSDGRFRWRTLERLAIEAGVTESEAHDILAAHPDQVVIGKSDTTGKIIARLKSA